MHSQAEEDYLKAIYDAEYEGRDKWVTTTTLAQRLGISPASVTEMLKRMSAPERDLVRYERYHGVQLTDTGEKAALEVVRHHRLIESFLASTLGLPWDQVHAEAHQLEHAISEELEDRIAEYLGNPARDPHGSPIPRRDGAVEMLDDMRLTDMPSGSVAVVRRVHDDDPALLRHLTEIGLVLGARVEVVEQTPFKGGLYVRAGVLPALHALGTEVTDQVFVCVEEGSPV